MRYLIIHSRYSRTGGEEHVVAFQRDLLMGAGHQVKLYERDYKEMKGWKFGKISTFFSSLYNRRSVREIRQMIDEFSPDVAIVHNLFPVVSPAVLRVLKRRGVRVLMTVHNYRLLCPTGLFYRNGRVCESCAGGCMREWNCLAHRCEGSWFGSLGYFFRSWWARMMRSYTGNVDRFMVVSTFQQRKLAEYGIPSDRISLLSNAVSSEGFGAQQANYSGAYVGFVGRLSAEKGVDLLLSVARALPDVPFRIAGDLASNYELSRDIPSNIEFMGFLGKEQLGDFYRNAGVIINTSGCYEGMPLSLLEAMSMGCVVVAQNYSVMPELLGDGEYGLLVEYGDVQGYSQAITHILTNQTRQKNIGRKAALFVQEKFSATGYLQHLECYSSDTEK